MVDSTTGEVVFFVMESTIEIIKSDYSGYTLGFLNLVSTLGFEP